MPNIEVVGLNYYPIKSCGGIKADEVAFSELGVKYDREWMLVGSKGQFLSQRVHPKLALVQTHIEDGSLTVTAPDMNELTIPLERDPDAEVIPITLFKKPGTGTDQGTDASGYFSEYLGRGARLLRIEQPRLVKPECRVDGASERTGFADGFPLQLTSTNSLAELNEHIEQPITIDRFRSNITVEGAPAYDEDYWREILIGKLRAFAVRASARCPIPNIDQQIGNLPKERRVTSALRATRQAVDPISGEVGEFFGQNIVHVFQPGTTVKVGDKILVVERASERNIQMTT